MEKIRVLLCDDIPYLCEYFEYLFKSDPNLELAGVSHTADDCFESIAVLRPDIILLDIQLNTNDEGLILLEKIKAAYPDIKVIMLTIHEEDEFIFRSFALGADDYILKTEPPEIIFNVIHTVYNNTSHLRPNIASRLTKKCREIQKEQKSFLYLINLIKKLTTAEYEILLELYKGKSYKEIAAERFVEEVTIRSQINKIVKKCEIKNVRELLSTLKECQIFHNRCK